MIRGSAKLMLALLCLSLVSAPAALAQTVSSSVQANLAGVITTDEQTPTSTINALSFLVPAGVTTMEDFARAGYGRAAQNLDGVGAVACEGVFVNADPTNSIVSNTLWTTSATNTTTGPVSYAFNFVIAPPALRLADYAGLDALTPNAPTTTFILEIRSNGAVVFHAEASMVGGINGHNLTETGTSLNPVFVVGLTSAVFGYDFDSVTDVIDLGSFNPGETVTVEYQMTASVVSGGFEVGGRAAVGDPFDLSGTPGFTGDLVTNTPVPVEDKSFGRVKAQY